MTTAEPHPIDGLRKALNDLVHIHNTYEVSQQSVTHNYLSISSYSETGCGRLYTSEVPTCRSLLRSGGGSGNPMLSTLISEARGMMQPPASVGFFTATLDTPHPYPSWILPPQQNTLLGQTLESSMPPESPLSHSGLSGNIQTQLTTQISNDTAVDASLSYTETLASLGGLFGDARIFRGAQSSLQSEASASHNDTSSFSVIYDPFAERASRMTPLVWSTTPLEILDHIALALAELWWDTSWDMHKPLRRKLAALSSTCRRWSQRCRPPIFRELKLVSRGDANYLESMLRSPLSGWLALHIEVLTLRPRTGMDSHALISGWKSLSRRLPHLSTVRKTFEHTTDVVPISYRPLPQCLRNVKLLDLCYCKWFSFSGFVRDVAAMPSLEKVVLVGPTWGKDHDQERRPPRFIGSFESLRDIECYCQLDNHHASLSLGWIFIVASLHRRALSGKDLAEEGQASDSVAMFRVLELLDALDMDSTWKKLVFHTSASSPSTPSAIHAVTLINSCRCIYL